jgi:hypothetical protein
MIFSFQNPSHPTPGPSPKREGRDVRNKVKGLFVADLLNLVSKN